MDLIIMLGFMFYHVGEKTYYTNYGINFFLYVMSGHKFRTDLRNLCGKKKGNGPMGALSGNTVSTITTDPHLYEYFM